MDLDVLGGIYFPGDAHLYPNQFMMQMKAALTKKGVQFIPQTSIIDFNCKGSKIESLVDKKNRIIKTYRFKSSIQYCFS